MSTRSPHDAPHEAPARCCVLVSGYGRGAVQGRNLGLPGYSYDFVVKLFEPLFRRFGEYELVESPEENLDARVAEARRRGLQPIHLCFRGLHDAVFASDSPNVPVPAWEFPDVPDHALDGDARHDWIGVANRSTALIVHGEFTLDAFVRGGVQVPTRIVPVPTPEGYFGVPDWNPDGTWRIACSSQVLDDTETSYEPGRHDREQHDREPSIVGTPTIRGAERPRPRLLANTARWAYKNLVRPLLPRWVDTGLTHGLNAAYLELANKSRRTGRRESSLDLSGVVYTSIFNPIDGRKNWDDLLTAYLVGLADCPDATMVLKLVGRNPHRINELFARYRALDLRHRCRLVVVTDFLTDGQMTELAEATTYYAQATRAEGNCLPLMNHLAAGRPGLSPCHTAIGDYFSDDVGFVVESHPEPCAWPQDPLLACRTTWHRPVWTSLVEAFRESHRIATNDLDQYERLASRAREVARERLHADNVYPRLEHALEAVLSGDRGAVLPPVTEFAAVA